MTELAIIIVSYNTRPELEACLGSLHDHPPVIPHEVIVVDNGSRDGSVAAVKQRGTSLRLIQTGDNLGFAKASNVGIRASRGELILLLNSDTIVPPNAVDLLAAALRQHPEVAAAGPRLVDERGRAELSFGRMIAPLTELRQKTLVRLHARGVPFVSGHVDRLTRREQYADWVSGACLLVRRADADAVGLLDEQFFMYGEDVDFCAQLRCRGRRVLFVPTAEIVHLGGRSARAESDRVEREYRRSHLAFYAKHHPRWTPLLRAYLKLRGKLPRE